jgi:hypothetical protein
MKAVLERICLQELVARRRTEQKTGCARANKVPQHSCQLCAEIHVPANRFSVALDLCSTLRLCPGLNNAALRLLANVERAAVLTDMLADLEAKRLAGAEWTLCSAKNPYTANL